jgi:type I restriction enzyme, S subunit
MGLKHLTTSLKSIASNRNLRLDYRFLEFAENKLPIETTPFRKFIVKLNNGKDVSKENYVSFNESDIIYPTVNNFKNSELGLNSVTFIDDDWLEENSSTLVTDDVIISRSGTVGITFVWNEDEINRIFKRNITAVPSGYLIVVQIDKDRLLPQFVKYYFSTELMKKYFSVFGVGKSQKNIAQPEILSIPIPNLSIEIQRKIVEKISPIDIEIQQLKSKIKPDAEIINEIFIEKFGWNTTKFNETKNIHLLNRTFSAFSNNIDNRFSFKFHNKAGEYVSNILKLQTSKRIKDYLAEDITLGKSISPSDYDENGEQCYLSMADIKNWCFETEDAKTVSQSYFDVNPNKRIALNDIIMARSGEGTIGKVAIIDNEENEAVYADFTMRIRLKDYNPTFAYYYFRTDYFQYLVYTNKKGLGNNTNIFPSQVRELPIPEISLAEQEKIVNAIKLETDKQREFDKKIIAKKKEINRLINNAIN